MADNRLKIGDNVKVINDETDELLGCVGTYSCHDYSWDAPYGIAFGKADNTVPLRNGEWGAWFERSALQKVKKDRSPICVTPED